MGQSRARTTFGNSVTTLFICLGMSAVLSFPSLTWGKKLQAPSSEGTTFSGFRRAADFYDEQGFLVLGKFEKAQWPATVISEKEADDEISFSLRSGPPHIYPGYIGYRLKVVVFEDAYHEETVLVFRSKKKRDGMEQPYVAKSAVSDRPEPLRTGLSLVAKQLSEQDKSGPKRRIAVIDFSDINGQILPAGSVIAELLIGELFKTGRYNIVERKLLSSVLEQHRLNMTGLVDESTARKVGKLLGVDYIVTGTVIDLGTSLNVNARTICIETGSIEATGSADIARDAFRNLPQTTTVPGTTVKPVSRPVSLLGDLPPATGSFTPWMEECVFTAELDRLWKDGYYPSIVEGRAGTPANEYRAVFQPFPKKVFWFYWWYGQVRSQYEEHKKRMTDDGYREISLQIFSDKDGMRRYQTCWLKYGP